MLSAHDWERRSVCTYASGPPPLSQSQAAAVSTRPGKGRSSACSNSAPNYLTTLTLTCRTSSSGASRSWADCDVPDARRMLEAYLGSTTDKVSKSLDTLQSNSNSNSKSYLRAALFRTSFVEHKLDIRRSWPVDHLSLQLVLSSIPPAAKPLPSPR